MNSNFAPWQSKGRWYRIVLEYDASKSDNYYRILYSDENLFIVGSNINITTGDKTLWISDIKSDKLPVADYQLVSVSIKSRQNFNGNYLALPIKSYVRPTGVHIFTLWVFGYFETETATQSDTQSLARVQTMSLDSVEADTMILPEVESEVE